MKENPNIDELLNSFIDGELDKRHQTEVHRLISHDLQVAERLKKLQKCRELLGSLPCVDAPAEMMEDIKASLERKTLLGRQQPADFAEKTGARHLLVRRVLAAAAMIGLVAILGVVIYTIVAPENFTDRPMAIEDWQQPAGEIDIQSSPTSPVVAKADTDATVFTARLELTTSALAAVETFINKTIEDAGLSGCAVATTQQDKKLYTLDCNRRGMNLLLANLKSIWDKFGSTALYIETGQFPDGMVVNAVKAEQVAEIVNQDSLARRIEVAKNFNVLNSMAERLPGREIFAAINNKKKDLITIPKPVLTSNEKTVKKTLSETDDEQKVSLTIVVIAGE